MKATLRSILVPLDGSRESEAALEAIKPILRAHDAEAILLEVKPEAAGAVRSSVYLNEMLNLLLEAGARAKMVCRTGPAAEAILEVAREKRIDLIAMTTHGRTGMKRILTGSVTEKVLRRAEVPVLVCRPGMKFGPWKKLLVALDGSDQAERILQDAADLARDQGATVDLVRVALPVVVGSGVGEIPMYLPSDDVRPYLKAVQKRMEKDGVEARSVNLEGRASTEILKHAEGSGASLICMTTHGRTGAARLLLGSIAEEILRHAPCPVFVRRTAKAARPARASKGT